MPRANITPDLGLPIALERTAPTPLHQQLCEQLRRAILDGRLSSGTRLPSTRTFAQALGVSRTVTSSAYDELFAEGYLVAPPLLRERIGQIRHLTDDRVSWPLQQMLAAFISKGHLDRHVRRMRHQYAEKRHIVAQTLAPIAHLARLRGLEAGLHAYLELGASASATLVAQLAQKRNVIVTPLDAYYLGTPDRSGLLLGYACLEIPDIIRGVTILTQIIEQVAALSHHS
jgi:DNA-binding transcriptional MocR family regulator